MIRFKASTLWPGMLVGAFLIAFGPMFWELMQGPWKTEQEGHGPLIIAGALWLVWRARARLAGIAIAPEPLTGWSVILTGLLLMFLARTQGVLTAEVLSCIITVAGCTLLLGGKPLFSALAFPIGFLLFAVPLPYWMIAAATVPLKVLISDTVTRVLYLAGYPVAHDGVMIVIGPYQLLVEDACSGMNSIFALSAIGVFYVYLFRRNSPGRGLALLLAIVPIAIAANFIRVLVLVLIAYKGGIDTLAGPLHAATGVGLFLVAAISLCAFDALLGMAASIHAPSPSDGKLMPTVWKPPST